MSTKQRIESDQTDDGFSVIGLRDGKPVDFSVNAIAKKQGTAIGRILAKIFKHSDGVERVVLWRASDGSFHQSRKEAELRTTKRNSAAPSSFE